MSEHPVIPEFTSNIPEHLLAGNDEARKWMMNELSKSSQKFDWLARENLRQSATLDRVEILGKITNGRVTKLESGAIEVKNTLIQKEKDIRQLVESKEVEIKKSLEDRQVKVENSLKQHDQVIEPINSFLRFITNKTYLKVGAVAVFIFGCGIYFIYRTWHQELIDLLKSTVSGK